MDSISTTEINQDIYLNDFIIETMVHIEEIESAFLHDSHELFDPQMIDHVFRAAHSIKGTAGFFSLEKIVSVAHELESVFAQLREGNITVDETLIDVVMASVDCLRELVNHIHQEELIDEIPVLLSLQAYTSDTEYLRQSYTLNNLPFDISEETMQQHIQHDVKKGQKLYYISIQFNRSLKSFYAHPERLLDGILSVSTILEVRVNTLDVVFTPNTERAVTIQTIKDQLLQYDTTVIDMLLTSVLEPELLSIAIEIDSSNIHLLTIEQQEANQYPNRDTNNQTNQTNQTASANLDHNSMILDISHINDLVDIANEMILTRNRLNATIAPYEREISGIIPILQDLNRLTSEIQEQVMLTRMQPISVVFGKFPRIIRDTAKILGKELEITLSGNHVMLDKYLLDSLTDPITQLVKNSADHGIETSERRRALGKPKKGMISLNAYTHNSYAFIEVKDDGAGINIEALKKKGVEQGFIAEEEASHMNEDQLFNLIFEPGFSTATKVTNMSGRGVGMDIVKTNIHRLGGSIEIESKLNEGTTCIIKMPLTLSVLRTIIVSIKGVDYAVPEMNVERILRIKHGDPHNRVEMLNESYVLSLHGRVLPLVTMEEVDAKSKNLPISKKDIWKNTYSNQTFIKCLILKTGHTHYALLVDDITGTEQTLVKPLPEYLKNCICYSNVTVLGNGNAIAILSAEGILRMLQIEGVQEHHQQIEESKANKKQYIIFKSNGPEFYALDTMDILRIEIFSKDKIQHIGQEEYVNLDQHTIHIIHTSRYLPSEEENYIADVESYYLLTLKQAKSPMGILASRVFDKIERDERYDKAQLCNEYILGTCSYQEKVLIFLNTQAIIADLEMRW